MKYWTWDQTKWVEIDPLSLPVGMHVLKITEESSEPVSGGGPRTIGESKTRFPIVLRVIRGNGGNT